jgi:hypothetical protein
METMPNRPRVRLNVALTDDGAMARDGGVSISCPADWHRVHVLRELFDAVRASAAMCPVNPGHNTFQQRLLADPRRTTLFIWPENQGVMICWWR